MKLRIVPAVACLMLIACKNADEKAVFTLTANGLLPDSVMYYIADAGTGSSGFCTLGQICLPPFCLTHSYSQWGFGYGFTYCHSSDTVTPGFSNLSAITGKGIYGDSYFTVRTDGGEYGHPAEVSFQNGDSFVADEVFVTNSVAAYLAMRDGNDGFGSLTFCKQDWGKEDWLKLTVTGHYDQYVTGRVSVWLADGRSMAEDWMRVDLSPLGEVKSLSFLLESSDSTETGMLNTPAVFCLDGLRISGL